MKVVAKRFGDFWRGDGSMVTFHFDRGWLCFAFRPRHWHLHYARLPIRPARRLYVGPFEIELMMTRGKSK